MKIRFVAIITIVLLITATVVTGCGIAGEPNFVNNYTETKIALPGDLGTMYNAKLNESKELLVVGSDIEGKSLCAWRSNPEKTKWEKVNEYPNLMPDLEGFERKEMDAWLTADGRIGVNIDYYQNYDFTGERKDFFYLISDESTDEVSFKKYYDSSDADRYHILDFNITPSGKYIISDFVGRHFYYDMDTGKLEEISDTLDLTFFSGDSVYVLNTKGCKITNPMPNDDESRLEQLKSAYKEVLSKEEGFYCNINYYDNGDTRDYYFASQYGVWKSSDEGPQKLVDGGHSRLGRDCYIEDVLVENENEYYVVTSGDEDGPVILKYTYSEEPVVVNTVLRAFILDDSDTDSYIQDIINDYQLLNPTVQIDLEVGIKDETDNVSDAVKKLNTELLSGEGPDILFMDGLNARKYAEEGVLSDITDEINIDNDDLLFDAGNNYRLEDKYYAFPAAFTCFSFSSLTKGREQPGDIKTFADGLSERCFPEHTYPIAAGILYREYFDGIAYQDGTVTEGELREFYENLNTIAQTYNKDDYRIDLDAYNLAVDYYDTASLLGSDNGGEMAMDYVESFKLLQLLFNDRGNEYCDFRIFNIDGDGAYVPGMIVGVTKDSKELEAAKKFIEYLFSEDGQVGIGMYGKMPVKTDGFVKAMRKTQGEIAITSGVFHELREFSDDEINETLDIMKNMKIPVGTDSEMMEIVMSGASRYISDGDDLDVVLSDVMDKINIYLSEKH